jgi:hypothetical protein
LENYLLKEIYELLNRVITNGTYISVKIYKGTHKTLTKKKFQKDEEKIIKEEMKHIKKIGSQ